MLDLSKVWHLFDGPLMSGVAKNVFTQVTLNEFMSLDHQCWSETRRRLKQILAKDCPLLRDDKLLREQAIVPMSDIKMHLPASIGSITCFRIVSKVNFTTFQVTTPIFIHRWNMQQMLE